MRMIIKALKVCRLVPVAIVSAAWIHLLISGLVRASDLKASEPVEAPPTPATTQPVVGALSIRPVSPLRSEEGIATGDRLKIIFFEMLDVPETKAGRKGEAHAALRTVYQRADLSGEHTVPMNGTIALPRLGVVNLHGHSLDEARALLQQKYEQVMRRKADVGIVVVDRAPVYVTGPVKTPGAYKYVPGMVVLHAIALSGGLERRNDGGPTLIAFVRERERFDGLASRKQRLIAQSERLQAMLQDRAPLAAPDWGQRAADETDAARLADAGNGAIVETLRLARQAVQNVNEVVENHRLEAHALEEQITQLSRQVTLRTERVASLERLKDKGYGQSTVLLTAQGEVAELEARQLAVRSRLEATKQRLIQAETSLGRQKAEVTLKITRAIASIAEELAETERMLRTQRIVMEVARRQLGEFDGSSSVFEIVRRDINGPQIMKAADTTSLMPGDVLRIRQASSRAEPDQILSGEITGEMPPHNVQSGR